MQQHDTIADLRHILAGLRRAGKSVGFVPTMGALHAGHRSLFQRARANCDVVVASIFVNPLQFGRGEDLDSYPRTLEKDSIVAADAGVDHLFVPTEREMYPDGAPLTNVMVSRLGASWEGAHRPGHFDGVAMVVAKLCNIVQPDRCYMGEKDWQQLIVVRRMVWDLSLPVQIIGCETMRDADGLALSSRNRYLDPDHRRAAAALHAALQAGAQEIAAHGESDPSAIGAHMMSVLANEPLIEPQYAVVVDGDLNCPEHLSGELRLMIAAQVGPARLIDNIGVAV